MYSLTGAHSMLTTAFQTALTPSIIFELVVGHVSHIVTGLGTIGSFVG